MVIGSGGQLGTDMCSEAEKAGFQVVGVDYPAIDIGNKRSVEEHVVGSGVSAVINCAAFTAVDACETEMEKAFLLNAEGVGNIAAAASKAGARMVHISTDYVFSGDKPEPYVETDATDPRSVYGKSKLEGERLVIRNCSDYQILRIAWLYGCHGSNFVKTIRAVAAKKAAAKEALAVVNDQVGTPTSTVQVSRQVLAALQEDVTGIFHATCEGSCSWYDFAKEIVAAAGIPVEMVPCSTEEFPSPTPRPKNSVLENRRFKEAGLAVMEHWKDAFSAFLQDENEKQEK